MKPNNRQQLLAILAIGAVAILVLDRLVITPLTAAWKSNGEEIIRLQKQISQGNVLLDRERIIKQSWESIRTNTLPQNATASENTLLKAFDRWSQDSRVSVSSIRPQWRRNNDDYSLLECRADCLGSIEALSRFIHDIEKDPLPLRIELVDMQARDNNGQQIALVLQLSGLILNTEEKR